MKKDLNPVLASHKARKQKEREKARREKLEIRTLKQAQVDGGGVKQRLDEEIKKIRDMRGPKGRKRKLPPHLQLKLNQLEALSKQVRQREVSTSRANIELSHRHEVFEKAERINEGLTDEDEDDDDTNIPIDPLNATLTDKARAGILDIDALKQERKRRGEHIRWHNRGEVTESHFEYGADEEDSDDSQDEAENVNKSSSAAANHSSSVSGHTAPQSNRATEDKSDSDIVDSSGSEIDEDELAALPPPPPVSNPANSKVIDPQVVVPPPPPPPPLQRPALRGPISYVGFSDPLPPPPMFPGSVASQAVYSAEATTTPAPPTTWMIPTSVASRLEQQAKKQRDSK